MWASDLYNNQLLLCKRKSGLLLMKKFQSCNLSQTNYLKREVDYLGSTRSLFYSLSFVVIFSSLYICALEWAPPLHVYQFPSAGWEFGVGEDSSAVQGVRVLRNVGDLDIMLGLTQFLHNLRVDIVLHASLGGIAQVFALVGITILLALPHERLFLRSHFEHGWVKRFNHRVWNCSLLVADWIFGLAAL